ncbi:MAG: hypothetical protein GQ475_02910 [Methylococcaceae bacterium]|nr:hypothetical protein [Methylococcaceae bacterium]
MASEEHLRNCAKHLERWKPIVPAVSDQLLPIVDKMFQRNREMSEAGLTFFQLDQKILVSLCENESEVEEHKQHLIFHAKYDVSRWCYHYIENIEKIERLREYALETGDYLDDEPTSFLKRYHKLRRDNPVEIGKFRDAFNQRYLTLWEEQIVKFTDGRYHDYSDWNKETIRLFIRGMFDEHAAQLGFTFCKKFSRHNIYAYSKPISGSWALFISADMTSIRHIVPNSSRGEDLNLVFGLVNLKSKKKSLYALNNLILPCKLEHFFPIHLVPSIARVIYSRFTSYRELESLINSLFSYYQIIAEEFEVAVTEGVNEIEANAVDSEVS